MNKLCWLLIMWMFSYYSYADCQPDWSLSMEQNNLTQHAGVNYLPVTLFLGKQNRKCNFSYVISDDILMMSSGVSDFYFEIYNDKFERLKFFNGHYSLYSSELNNKIKLYFKFPFLFNINPGVYIADVEISAIEKNNKTIVKKTLEHINYTVPAIATIMVRGSERGKDFLHYRMDLGELSQGSSGDVWLIIQSNIVSELSIESTNKGLMQAGYNEKINYNLNINDIKYDLGENGIINHIIKNNDSGNQIVKMNFTVLDDTSRYMAGKYNDSLKIKIKAKL